MRRSRNRDPQPEIAGLQSDRGERRRPPVDYRYSLANERTFLAWIRTALALLGASAAVLHLLGRLRLGLAIGTVLAIMGVVVAAAGHRRWKRNSEAILRGAPLHSTRVPGILALCILVVGVLLLVERLVAMGAGT